MDNPPDPPNKIREKPLYCGYDGPAPMIPPEKRVKRKRYPRIDEPVVPRSYWYWTAGLMAAALTLGLFLGRFLLG